MCIRDSFGADFAYTVDGDVFGGIDNENFNATALQVSVAGLSTHPGAAKNKMINACLVAMEFQSMLPVAQRPEYTEGREGFFHLTNMTGSAEKASLTYILRDHDRALLERRKELAKQAAVFLNHKYGPGTVTLDMRDTYYNMAEMLLPHPEILELAHEAIVSLGGTPVYIAARGGTDGSRLSFMGLPCPTWQPAAGAPTGALNMSASTRWSFAQRPCSKSCALPPSGTGTKPAGAPLSPFCRRHLPALDKAARCGLSSSL